MTQSAYEQAVEIAKAAIQASPNTFLRGSDHDGIEKSAEAIVAFIEKTALHLEASRERFEIG